MLCNMRKELTKSVTSFLFCCTRKPLFCLLFTVQFSLPPLLFASTAGRRKPTTTKAQRSRLQLISRKALPLTMDKEKSSRRRRESDSHRDRETSKDNHHHHRSKHDKDCRRSDEHPHRLSDTKTECEGSWDRDMRHERKMERKQRKERGERSNKRARVYEGNGREMRRFEDVKLKEDDRERKQGESLGFGEKPVKKETKYELRDSRQHNRLVPLPMTIENKGVNINRSHEVPGKSSTDGIAPDAGKSRGLSLDALAKAKRALQMQKELAERMKKIPLLNRDSGSTGDGSPKVIGKVVAKSSSAKGILPVPISPLTSSIMVPAGVTQSTSTLPVTSVAAVTPQSGLPHLPGLTTQKYEAVKRAQGLAAKMGFRQDPEFAALINMFPGQMPADVNIQPKPSRAPVLRLDALGREVDEHGNVVNFPKVNSFSTLKVNINKQNKEAFEILKPELEVDPDKNPHFDARVGID
ncbi:hypothetical protein BUALT_Bualt03G0024100 [Buddleja alternifolia]|uniref:Uncharacterized protein n=1 Tax=Buddleja alternifolia TaxID=168488 RepID=A0AAV6XQH6_9LAMI|nr:hypothetical protein BUALT_Bualt03G0024100 [Buddleja alternifolia]